MRKISGHYTDKFETEVEFDASIPSTWEELDAKQFATIIQLLTYEKADRFTITASVISVLFGAANWHILNNLPEEELHALVPLTNFIFESVPPLINKFPTLKIRKKICAAPADDFSNLCFGEWCFAYEFYSAYLKYREPEFLHKLIVTLYRPIDPAQKPDSVNFSGDIREIFNENLLNDRARGLKDVQDHFKNAVFAWACAAFTKVMSDRPNVFPIAKQGESEASDPDGDGRTWLTVFRELLGPKWGTSEQLKFTNAMFVLDALEEQHIEFNKAAAPTE